MSSIKGSDFQNTLYAYIASLHPAKDNVSSKTSLDAQNKKLSGEVDAMVSAGTLDAATGKKMKDDLAAMQGHVPRSSYLGSQDPNDPFQTALRDVSSLADALASETQPQPGSLVTRSGDAQPSVVSDLNSLKGSGDTSFAKFMHTKYHIDMTQDSSTIAERMASEGMKLYTDTSGNAVVYDPSTNTGGGFGKNGSSISTPDAFWKHKDNHDMTKPAIGFSVGSMHFHFDGAGLGVSPPSAPAPAEPTFSPGKPKPPKT